MSQGGCWAIREAARQGASSSAHVAGFSRAQAHVLQDPGGEGLVAKLVQLAHHLDGLGVRRCRERALGVLGLAGHVEEGTITESVSVKSSLIFGKSLLMWS